MKGRTKLEGCAALKIICGGVGGGIKMGKKEQKLVFTPIVAYVLSQIALGCVILILFVSALKKYCSGVRASERTGASLRIATFFSDPDPDLHHGCAPGDCDKC